MTISSGRDILCFTNDGKTYRKTSGDKDSDEKLIGVFPNLIKSKVATYPNGSCIVQGTNGIATFDKEGILTNIQKTPTNIYLGVLAFDDQETLILSNQGIQTWQGDSLTSLPGIPFGDTDFFTSLIKLTPNRFVASYRQIELWDISRTPTGWKVDSKIPMPGETNTAILRNDTLFAGTSAGLLTIVNDSIVATFNPEPLGNLWVNAIHEDDRGRLWLGTEQGLVCYFPSSGNYQYYGEADGLPDSWFIRANVIDRDSAFIMATKTGLVTVNTSLADDTLSDNKIYLSDIWINGIRDETHSLYDPQPLDLDYQHNSVSFLPGMIELGPSELSGFKHRLVGLQEDYTYGKSGEVVRYPSIPPGNYTFEFVGVDKNGRSTLPFTLQVRISPPFYQTWWFWLLCGAGVFSGFYYFNRRAVRRETERQQAIQKEQARQAAETLARHQAVVSEQRRIMMELHDDLGGTLGSLFYKLDGYLLDQESGLEINPDFEQLKNTSGEAMKKLREVMKSNVAKELPLPVFARKLVDMARASAQSARLEWTLERDDAFPEIELSSQQVHNALLIFKEALQNIRKHAKATSFSLRLHLDPDNTFLISLTDDGIGMPSAAAAERHDGTGNGLHNMRRRAADLQGTLSITSPPAGGTVLQLHFPLT
ncbi:ATP-binding protein [Neolewinella agarilytica]|nr:ATP-binding protein [Neolewinella agarilytica]